MSEHTPGPWKVDSKYCVGPVSQEDDQSYGMIIPVADVYGPNIQADAELIASAPQLREQNRVLRSNLVNCVARLEAYYGEDYPAVRDAKAALDGGKGVQGGK